MTDTTTTTVAVPRTATTYLVQHAVTLYERAEDVGSTATEVTAWVDLGEAAGLTRKAAIKAIKEERGITSGRFRALTMSSAATLEPRTETVTREVW
jgi:hypothetical protein